MVGMIDINLVNCALDCEYQKDGNCTLNDSVPITLNETADCSYYRKRRPVKKAKKENKTYTDRLYL